MATYIPAYPQNGARSPQEEVLAEIARIQQEMDSQGQRQAIVDEQELADRQEATEAYAGENPKHFVDYCEECCNTSSASLRDIRQVQQECFLVYQEQAPPNYTDKEDWQSRVILPKPYSAVQFAVSAVSNAFSPTFLSVTDAEEPQRGLFWKKLLEWYLNEQHASFVLKFADAVEMGFAVGQSFEMIPIWDARKGVQLSLVEPWKVHRDPDALNREPWSGMYMIHEEWLDLWTLREGEKQGRYTNTEGLQNESGETAGQNQLMHRSSQARLRQYVNRRNKFRHAILTREFWGTVLAPNGEMLLPDAVYTVAGTRLIAAPQKSPYPTLRWPAVSFSPLPHLLRQQGRSLLQSIRSLWYLMCNLLALHADYQNWIVNPMREINVHGLINQDDVDIYPGKTWETRETVSGQQVVRTVDQRFITNDILVNQQFLDQTFQRGTFVTDAIQGLPGYRALITAREAAQNLQQSSTVFGKIGKELDIGAIDVIEAIRETLALNITRQDLLAIFTPDELVEAFGHNGDGRTPTIFKDDAANGTGVDLPLGNATMHVSGLQALLKDFEKLQTIQNIIVPMTTHPVFNAFIRPYNVAKSIEMRANLQDEGMLIDKDEAEQVMQAQSQRAEGMAQLQHQAMQQQLELGERKMQLEEQQAQFEVQANQLEQQKIALEAAKMQMEAQQQGVELQATQAQSEADLAKQAMEIAAIQQQLRADMARVAGDLLKVNAAIAKSQAQVELQARKIDLEHQRGLQQMRLEHQRAEQAMALEHERGEREIQLDHRRQMAQQREASRNGD